MLYRVIYQHMTTFIYYFDLLFFIIIRVPHTVIYTWYLHVVYVCMYVLSTALRQIQYVYYNVLRYIHEVTCTRVIPSPSASTAITCVHSYTHIHRKHTAVWCSVLLRNCLQDWVHQVWSDFFHHLLFLFFHLLLLRHWFQPPHHFQFFGG